jgi:hypothetical protein
MGHRAYCIVSGILFSLVSLAHLLRIVFGLPIQIDDVSVPVLLSWLGFIVPGGLAIWALRIARGSKLA